LVVDDDQDMLALLSNWLKKAGFEVETANSGSDALTRIGIARPNVVVTDLYMEGMDGMTLIGEVHRQNPLLPVIMLSGRANIPDAIKATHLGISAFLTKPIEQNDLVEQIRHTLRLSAANESEHIPEFGKNIVHRSARMAELLDQARLVAESDVTIFINGQTGTGKEVLARAIHEGSPRRDKAFIGVNCGAIPEQLLESELFGHEKGAFTGAITRHDGLFQAANGGTLFLDEIGDMPLPLQVKLLRVLQDFQVRPVGSTRTVPINVRIISATHNNLEKSVKAREFREDLYYRLNVVPLYIPGLSERREDIPLLLDYYLEKIAGRRRDARKRFSPEALEYLMAAPWPGNIRQLINVVEQCSALSRTDIIPLTMARQAMRDEPGQLLPLVEARRIFDKNYLISVLRVTDGQVAQAAQIAGRNRTEFYKLLDQHNIDPTEFRAQDTVAGH
jgi:two-component system response regulator GlrR